jgi:hypothetical protein
MTAMSVGTASRTGTLSHKLAKNRMGLSLRPFFIATCYANVTYWTIAAGCLRGTPPGGVISPSARTAQAGTKV